MGEKKDESARLHAMDGSFFAPCKAFTIHPKVSRGAGEPCGRERPSRGSQCPLDQAPRGLTEGLHGLHQLEGEGLVAGQLLQHASHLVVARAHDVVAVDALDMVAHADHLHVVHHAVVLDALPGRHGRRTRAN